MTQIIVERSGLFTTVHDNGRVGSRLLGIGPGGPTDPFAALVANLLVGNDADAAFLEIHFPAPTLRFETDAVIAICGANFRPSIDGVAVANWQAIAVTRGSFLAFNDKRIGNRAYIAVYGGLDSDEWLGSRSTNLKAGIGGVGGRRLADGDVLTNDRSIKPFELKRSGIVSTSIRPIYSAHPTVRVLTGPEFDRLDKTSKEAFFNETFALTNNSDRMGARLSGPQLSPADGSMVSTGVAHGTIQLLPDGFPVVLLADHQVTGGYPRIGQIITADLGLAGQLGPGDRVSFHEVDIETAEQALLAIEQDLNLLKIACKFQSLAWKS